MNSNDAALQALNELAELGMVFARRLGAEVEAASGQALCALTDALCDVGRGVRQCIVLSMRIRSGAFAAGPQAEAAGREPPEDASEAAEASEAPERAEGPERPDWYERPDWNIRGLRADEPITEQALQAAVTRIRRSYARADAVLSPRPASRASLLGGEAALRLVDSS